MVPPDSEGKIMNKKLLLAVALSLVVIVSLIGCKGKGSDSKEFVPAFIQPVETVPSQAEPEPTPPPLPDDAKPLTMLSITEGEVLIRKANSASWIKAEVGMTLEKDDTLKTGSDARAMVTFFEGSTIELEPGTEVSVIELGIADSGSTTINLGQEIGRTVSRVKKLADTASSYEVQTPTGVGAVRGSTMLVDVSPNGNTIIRNLGGSVSAIVNGIEYAIPEFMQIELSPDGLVLGVPTSILSHIMVMPSVLSVPVDTTQSFTAQGYDVDGNAVNGLPYAWSCANAVAGSINPATGEFTAGRTTGTFTDAIQVTSVGVTGTASVIVMPGPATRISVETESDGSGSVVPSQSVTAGDTVTGYAITRDQYDNYVANASAAWSLANRIEGTDDGDLIASEDGKSATFTGHLVGAADIHVIGMGLESFDSGTLTVVPGPLDHIIVTPSSNVLVEIGTKRPFDAQGYDRFENPISGLTYVWSCNDAAAGSVDPSTGEFTAGYIPGSYDDAIQVTSGDVTATTPVIVTMPTYSGGGGGGYYYPPPAPADSTAPVVTITAPENGAWYSMETLPDLAYTVTDDFGSDPEVTIEGWDTAEGKHTVTVTATDSAGNAGSASVTYWVDNTPPVVEITAPIDGAWYSMETLPELAYTVTDDFGSEPSVIVDGWSTENGEHTVTVTATDSAGNVGSASVTYWVDNTPPVVEITAPIDGEWYSMETLPDLAYTVTDDFGSDPEVTIEGWDTAEGKHTVTVTATDASGNAGSASVTYWIDNTPPVVEITAPIDGEWYSMETLPDLAYTVTDNFDSEPSVIVDGWSTENGEHTVTVTATDAAGNVGSASITYWIDNTPPVVEITAPIDGEWYSMETLPDLAYTVTDNLDSEPSVTVDGWSTENGEHTVTVTATDAAGNVGSTSITYTVLVLS